MKIKRSKYQFGGKAFSSKSEVTKYVSGIRQALGNGGDVTDKEAVAVLTDLLRSHVEADQKIGGGIKRFFVAMSPNHPVTCFWLERKDGTKTDFGIPSCLNGPHHLNRQSLRMLVRKPVEAFRRNRIKHCGNEFVSDYSKRSFPVEEAVADHFPLTFEEIVVRFANAEGIDLDREMLTQSRECRSEPTRCDAGLPKRFLDFHSQFGLRLVHSLENLSAIRRDAGVVGKTP